MNSDPDMLLPPFETASILLQALFEQGVRHAVISPGSRSTPLTLALASHDGFKKNVVLDERSAAFIALGAGKESGVPSILVCTSGTAAANYFPAVTEAKQSGVPMIVLTADRPPNLRGTGSSQTIDQIKMYGDHAVFFHETGEPADNPRDRDRVRFLAKQAVSESVQKGGAAHLNLPFRKPLEPPAELMERLRAINKKQIEAKSSKGTSTHRAVSPSKEISEMINRAEKPLIIAGPANRHHSNTETAALIAEIIGSPIVAEPGSRFHTHGQRIHRFEQFLRNEAIRSELKPDLILRFGDQPFTKSILTSLNSWSDVPTVRFAGRNAWQDHEMAADHIIVLTSADTFETRSLQAKNDQYLDKWKEKDAVFGKKMVQELQTSGALTDGHVFHHLSNFIPDSWNMMLSNSLPPRDAALFGNPGKQVIVNRGAAGIDGILSTAIGSALATGAPTCCIAGDLALLHDSNALLSLKHLEQPFIIVAVNNNGGNIFRMLPIFEHTETYQYYFETPQNVAFEHLARAHNIHYERISDKNSLEKFSFTEGIHSGPLLIECVTNPDESMKMRKELWKGV